MFLLKSVLIVFQPGDRGGGGGGGPGKKIFLFFAQKGKPLPGQL